MTTESESNDSVIGRLLQEISWEGANVKGYHRGGVGRENVLTAEVLWALDLLPRQLFLARVMKAAHGADSPGQGSSRRRSDCKCSSLASTTSGTSLSSLTPCSRASRA